MKRWKTESSLEEGIRNLPDKRPPADLRKRIMRALPEYKEPWFRRMARLVGSSPVGFRFAGVIVSVVLTFYGGMQFNRYSQGSRDVSSEALTVMESINDKALFYLGRSLLAAGESTEALNAFSRAELLQPDNPQYPLWKGAAYRALGDLDKERETYRQLVSKRPDLLPARLQLAGNLLEDGQASQAQQLYEEILASNPREKSALYNRAVALRMQGNSRDEAEAWKSYLDCYRSGDSASEALRHLNDRGDYSFRKYQLGSKSIILNQERLLAPDEQQQKREIEHLTRHLRNDSPEKVSIVVFVQDDAEQAKAIAQSLHKAIAGREEGIGNDSVGLSWFDKAEPVKAADKGTISLSKGVLIFSAPKDNRNKEKEI